MMVPYDACYITQEVSAALHHIYTSRHSVSFIHHTLFSFSLSEWQLHAAHAVVGQPTETLLPSTDVHSCPVSLPLGPFSLLLPLRHGSADLWAGTGYTSAGNHRCISFWGLVLSCYLN